MQRLLMTTALTGLLTGGVAFQADAQSERTSSQREPASLAETLDGVEFSSLDENGDGEISAEEFTSASDENASPAGPLTGTFSAVDVDASGKISQKEFEQAKKPVNVTVESDAAAGGATGNGDAVKSMTVEDQQARQRAMEGAGRMGLRDVRILEKVFVVEGMTPQNEVVYMLVNPPGATLVGIGRPLPAGPDSGNPNQPEDSSAGAGPATDEGASTAPGGSGN